MCRCRAFCVDHVNGTHPEGSTWHPNSCTSCTCDTGGKLSCKETVCSTACNDPLPAKPGTCCPICPIAVSIPVSFHLEDKSILRNFFVPLFSADEGERCGERWSSSRQRVGHSADHLDHNTLVVLPGAHRPHSSQPIPGPSLTLRDILLHLPSPILQMRASVRHAGASKRENCTLVKDCLTNRGKREIYSLDRRSLLREEPNTTKREKCGGE